MDPNFLEFEQPIAELEAKISELRLVGTDNNLNIADEIKNLREKSIKLTEKIYANLSSWQVSQVARHPLRRRRHLLGDHHGRGVGLGLGRGGRLGHHSGVPPRLHGPGAALAEDLERGEQGQPQGAHRGQCECHRGLRRWPRAIPGALKGPANSTS